MAFSATHALPFAGRRGQRFHRLPLLIPAEEVHPVVCTRRIAPQHVLDEADGLDIFGPVERCAQPEAGHGVGDRDPCHGLALMLSTNGLFRRRVAGCEIIVDSGPHGCEPKAELTDRCNNCTMNAGAVPAGSAPPPRSSADET